MSDVRQLLLDCGHPVEEAVLRAEKRLPGADPLRGVLLDWAGNMRITRGLSLNTVAQYLEAVSQFMFWLVVKGKGLDDVDLAMADEWARDLYVKLKQGARTRSLKLTALRQFFLWREERGHGVNKVRGLRGPRKPKSMPTKYTHAELKAMLSSCGRQTLGGKRDYALLLLFLCTGCRASEAAGLTLEQIELAKLVGRVRFDGKGQKQRSVSFEGPLIGALVDWLEAREVLPLADPQRVFASLQRSSRGKPLGRNGIASVMNDTKSRAELKCRVHPHKFRVTFATELYDQGHELEEIRVLLGHESIETTRQYLAVAERVRRARLKAKHVRILAGEQAAEPLWLAQKKQGEREGPNM